MSGVWLLKYAEDRNPLRATTCISSRQSAEECRGSRAVSFIFWMYRLLTIFGKKLACFKNTLYICSVKSSFLAIRVSFPRGASLYRHYPFKSCYGSSFLFHISPHENSVEIRTQRKVTHDGYRFLLLISLLFLVFLTEEVRMGSCV